MQEGFYSMYYTGQHGSGMGLLAFVQGKVIGADVTGGKFEGTYANEDGGGITGNIRMHVPAGTMLVTGQAVRQQPYTVDLPVALPADFGNGETHRLDLAIGPLNIRFEKLADFPG